MTGPLLGWGETMSEWHDDLIIFDGLIISNWNADVFANMRRDGLSGANCTCCVWEGFAETMRNIAQRNLWFRDHAELVVKARTTADTRRAKAEGRTAIVFGFQNVSAFEDQLGGLDWVGRDLGWALTAEEVACAGEGHDHCTFEVTPAR